MDLSNLSTEEIKKLALEKKIGLADFIDSGICPTCFDRENDNALFGDNSDNVIYEDEDFECFLAGNPRCEGHTIISTKKHFKNMMECDDDTCAKIFVLARKVMNIIKDVYGAECVYICSMSDGPMNHFHVQLIPRYDYEKRGSKNFVKPRMDYVYDCEKVKSLREKIDNVK